MSNIGKFQCHICEQSRKNLYSVRMSLWHEPDEFKIKAMEKHMNSLSFDQAKMVAEGESKQYGLSRCFVCSVCLRKFEESNRQIVPINRQVWRLSAPDWYKLKDGGKPAIYNLKKWESYQNKRIKAILQG